MTNGGRDETSERKDDRRLQKYTDDYLRGIPVGMADMSGETGMSSQRTMVAGTVREDGDDMVGDGLRKQEQRTREDVRMCSGHSMQATEADAVMARSPVRCPWDP